MELLLSETADSEPRQPANPWALLQKDYEVQELLGRGAFGQVARARCRTTGKAYAIKLIQNVFHSSYEAKKIVREI